MKTLKRYDEIIMNWFNGNHEDFKSALKGLTKKEILVLESIMAGYFGPEDDYKKANNAIYKAL